MLFETSGHLQAKQRCPAIQRQQLYGRISPCSASIQSRLFKWRRLMTTT